MTDYLKGCTFLVVLALFLFLFPTIGRASLSPLEAVETLYDEAFSDCVQAGYTWARCVDMAGAHTAAEHPHQYAHIKHLQFLYAENECD